MRHFGQFLRTSATWALAGLLLLGGGACSNSGTAGDDPSSSTDASADAGQGAGADAGKSDVQLPAPSTPTSALTLKALNPTQGRASGGETVELIGSGFVEGVQVLFGNTPIDADAVFVIDAGTLQIKTPPHDPGLVDVTVVVPGDKPASASLPGAFLYFNDLLITKIEPAEGPIAGGTAVSISGTGFKGKTTVLIGGKPALGVQVLADDQAIAITPPGVFGPANVHVVNERGAGLLKKGFFYTAAPSVAYLEPAAGPTDGGTVAVVHGQGFTKDTVVSIGNGKASLLEFVNAATLKIATPAGPEGKAEVAAATKYGTGKLAGGFVYTDDNGAGGTQLLSVAPGQGPLAGGGQAAVIATGLVSASDTTILFGGAAAKVLSVSAAAHTALVVVPKGAQAGAVDVTVMTSKGTSVLKDGYNYIDQLTVTGVKPAAGPVAGGTPVTITGSGFAKGAPAVKFGALGATNVAVVDDGKLTAVTPKGAPGYANVSVKVGAGVATLANGFEYSSGELALYVPFPASGAQAGGTLVHLYGSGFAADMQVRFGGKAATHFSFLDPTHITCKTPPGKVGAADVEVQVGGKVAKLPSGYTYFNPMSAYGGTWGSEIDGSLNITVIDASNNKPVPDCFVMLWTDPSTPYQGFTNADGQITFSGEDLVGKQMISASKPGYESASVIHFDATNVTVLIHPNEGSPSSGPPPPPPPPLPSVSGHVIGLDKYVFVPMGSCTDPTIKVGAPAPTCNACNVDADCGNPDAKCVDMGGANGRRCLLGCDASCTGKFRCQPVGDAGTRCVPQAGELTAICYHSKETFLSQDNEPPEGALFEAKPANKYTYKITTGWGEQAIVCFGGYKKFGSQLVVGDGAAMLNFTPLMMGVKRHVTVQPTIDPNTGKAKTTALKNVDVTLNVPLTASAQLRLDKPPVWPTKPGGQIINFADGHLVFGSDGAIRMPQPLPTGMVNPPNIKFAFEASPDQLVLNALPAALSGDIHDASLTFNAMVVEYWSNGLDVNTLPYSITVRSDVHVLNNDAMVRRIGQGEFETQQTGVNRNINGMWGTSSKNLYAVGAQGTVIHWGGNGWSVQPTFTKQDLYGVYGADAAHVWAVGWAGTVGFYDGSKWTKQPVTGAGSNLHGVFAAPDGQGGFKAWAAGQAGIWQLGQNGTWTKVPGTFFDDFAIHGADKDNVWAVGQYGNIQMWNGVQWKSQASGTSIKLKGVWAVSAKSVYAVGEAGQILRYDGTTWKQMPSPVKTTLTSVWANSDSDVWAAGQRGVILHYDGKAWAKVKAPVLDKALNAIWAGNNGDVVALGEQEMLMGPLLYPPLVDMPVKPSSDPGVMGTMTGNTIKWTVDPATVEPHFNYLTIGIPGMGPDTPVWNIMEKGILSAAELPDFPAIQGTPGIPTGKPLRLTVIRGYKEGFDIDHYDDTDLNSLQWRSWAVDQFFFQRQ